MPSRAITVSTQHKVDAVIDYIEIDYDVQPPGDDRHAMFTDCRLRLRYTGDCDGDCDIWINRPTRFRESGAYDFSAGITKMVHDAGLLDRSTLGFVSHILLLSMERSRLMVPCSVGKIIFIGYLLMVSHGKRLPYKENKGWVDDYG